MHPRHCRLPVKAETAVPRAGIAAPYLCGRNNCFIKNFQIQLSFKIVIDPGHGGKAAGAIGPNGEKEKDITLVVGKMLAKRLTEEGFEVFLIETGFITNTADCMLLTTMLTGKVSLMVSSPALKRTLPMQPMYRTGVLSRRIHLKRTSFLCPLINGNNCLLYVEIPLCYYMVAELHDISFRAQREIFNLCFQRFLSHFIPSK
jgi:hypothetical protein